MLNYYFMRKQSSAIFLVACLQTAAWATPTSYSIDFFLNPTDIGNPTFDIVPTSGGFDYDPSNATTPFSNFTVEWRGVTFDLTSAANFMGFTGFGCDSQTAPPAFAVNTMFQSFTAPCGNGFYAWQGNFDPSLQLESFVFEGATPAFGEGAFEQNILIPSSGTDQSGEGSFSVEVSPEPASWAILGLGLLAIAGARIVRARGCSVASGTRPQH
jgi:hypothetical protein